VPRHRDDSHRKNEASRLSRLRESLGLQQKDLASLLGVAAAAVNQWEKGSRTIPGPVEKLLTLYEQDLGLEPRAERSAPPLGLPRTAANAAAVLFALGLQRTFTEGGFWGSSLAKGARLLVAKRFVESLGNLKGLSMKLGQILATVDVALSDEARAMLAEMPRTAPAMPAALTAKQVLEDLGETPRRLFASWTPEPFAVASLGQVHRAIAKDGTALAVKVQYPKMARVLEEDLRHVARLEKLWTAMFSEQAPNVVFAELRKAFLAECDYRAEAAHQEGFRRAFASRRGIIVPRVFSELSGNRVLTMELVEGKSLDAFVADATTAEKRSAAESIFRFHYESIFRRRLFHADPHPGNLLFSGGAVAFLDFGRVREFSPAFVRWWREALLAVSNGRDDQARELFRESRLLRDPTTAELDLLWRTFASLWAPYREGSGATFDADYVRRTWRAFVVENPLKFRLNLSGEFVLLSQLQWGVSATLARIGVKLDWPGLLRDVL
jgi:predicted unusual protein kinase regulating ubiquinone biosynthesis (AarF/ABC1/UbiB family)/DNA-binding XRE family transcriptional regulator